MKLPYLKATRQYNEIQDIFLGYNHNLKIRDNEWYDATNISPRAFPMFAAREPRGVIASLTAPQALIARDSLVYVDGDSLYINKNKVAGLVLTTTAGMVPKTLISMGAYIIIMPDKKYVNTASLTDYGSIDSVFSYMGDVAYAPARIDGTNIDMENIPVLAEPPVTPVNGDYWIDTSDITGDVLRQYSVMSDTWTEISSTYTKITLTGIGAYFNVDDGVEIAGCAFDGAEANLTKQIPALNGSKIIFAKGTNYIIVSGLLSQVHTQTGATITVKREMPAMDFITECNNRLWGCKYGLVGSQTINEIYACALGDFKNWQQFRGISTDSYAANVGTDGKFTGAITHLGYPLFFKENNLHKIYGSMPSNYRVETLACRGVQEGSHKSLAIVNELLFYKGRTEVLVYDGSLPLGVSEALGGISYKDAVAGAYKDRYYISMSDSTDFHLFCYDTSKRLWFREDNTKVMEFAQNDDDLYFIDATTKKVMSVFGKTGTKEAAVAFSATSGIIGYTSKDHKYVSRINIRANMADSSTLTVSFRYDSTGDWTTSGTIAGTAVTRTVMLPLRPRRCDHFEMKLSGAGDVRIFGIARVLEVGSDGR